MYFKLLYCIQCRYSRDQHFINFLLVNGILIDNEFFHTLVRVVRNASIIHSRELRKNQMYCDMRISNG